MAFLTAFASGSLSPVATFQNSNSPAPAKKGEGVVNR